MTQKPVAHIGHRTHGRVRFRVPARRHDREFFDNMRKDLAACPGIGLIQVNPKTASILVSHSCDYEQLAGFIDEKSLFQLSPASATARQKGFVSLDTDLQRLLPFLLVALGMVQLTRGSFLGPAATLFWMAMQSARDSKLPR